MAIDIQTYGSNAKTFENFDEFKYSNMNTCQTYIGLMNNVVACNYRGPSSQGRPIIYKGNTAAVNYLADKYP